MNFWTFSLTSAACSISLATGIGSHGDLAPELSLDLNHQGDLVPCDILACSQLQLESKWEEHDPIRPMDNSSQILRANLFGISLCLGTASTCPVTMKQQPRFGAVGWISEAHPPSLPSRWMRVAIHPTRARFSSAGVMKPST